MKSIATPYTHTGVTIKEISTTVSPSSTPVTVPAETLCILLEGPNATWVVQDLRFIEQGSMLFWDADHYGIRIPKSDIANITKIKS